MNRNKKEFLVRQTFLLWFYALSSLQVLQYVSIRADNHQQIKIRFGVALDNWIRRVAIGIIDGVSADIRNRFQQMNISNRFCFAFQVSGNGFAKTRRLGHMKINCPCPTSDTNWGYFSAHFAFVETSWRHKWNFSLLRSSCGWAANEKRFLNISIFQPGFSFSHGFPQ